MSNIAQGEQLTAREVQVVAALDALTPSSTQAIVKTGATTFSTIATGTGNFAFELPGGTVNGTNAQFTVFNLPVFMEVGGQIMVSQTQDPTNYGYTVAGSGPYTITFVTAPAVLNGQPQTPHSFHN